MANFKPVDRTNFFSIINIHYSLGICHRAILQADIDHKYNQCFIVYLLDGRRNQTFEPDSTI